MGPPDLTIGTICTLVAATPDRDRPLPVLPGRLPTQIRFTHVTAPGCADARSVDSTRSRGTGAGGVTVKPTTKPGRNPARLAVPSATRPAIATKTKQKILSMLMKSPQKKSAVERNVEETKLYRFL